MAFSNVYDVTFPPDTQLANLLGQDLRNFRTDVQQRMSVISGLDASKPAFSGDAQPANWNGILFFATDTGQIYQWNNPVWTNITGSFLIRSGNTIKTGMSNPPGLSHTGTTTLDTIYSLTIPANLLTAQSIVRMNVMLRIAAFSGGGNDTLQINWGGAYNIGTVNITSAYNFQDVRLEVLGGNYGGNLLNQTWSPQLYVTGQLVIAAGGFGGGGAYNTANSILVTVQYQNSNSANTQRFQGFVIEVL